jgi:hypothetical protein
MPAGDALDATVSAPVPAPVDDKSGSKPGKAREAPYPGASERSINFFHTFVREAPEEYRDHLRRKGTCGPAMAQLSPHAR